MNLQIFINFLIWQYNTNHVQRNKTWLVLIFSRDAVRNFHALLLLYLLDEATKDHVDSVCSKESVTRAGCLMYPKTRVSLIVFDFAKVAFVYTWVDRNDCFESNGRGMFHSQRRIQGFVRLHLTGNQEKFICIIWKL